VDGFIWLKKGSSNGLLRNSGFHKNAGNTRIAKMTLLQGVYFYDSWQSRKKGPNNFIITVCISAATNGRISLKFDMGNFVKM
jgi:hypothetical protein